MSRVYIQMDTIQNIEQFNEDLDGIYVPPTGSCDDCTIFDERLSAVEDTLPTKITAPQSANNGDFLVYSNGSWAAMSLAVWQGGAY